MEFCQVLRFAGAAKTAKIVGVNSYFIDISDEQLARLCRHSLSTARSRKGGPMAAT